MSRLDKWLENQTRNLARKSSRRSFLARFGTLLVGVTAMPLLPISRLAASTNSGPGNAGDPGDPRDCDYWRYCAIDGFLCACCGGTVSSCPPGTVLSPITWIGTCQNPADGTHYIISYNDSCGQSACGQCQCMRNERDRPVYMTSQANDINWCSGSSADVIYNCSIAAIIGVNSEG
jgi:methylamine dehydrogenase light chain